MQTLLNWWSMGHACALECDVSCAFHYAGIMKIKVTIKGTCTGYILLHMYIYTLGTCTCTSRINVDYLRVFTCVTNGESRSSSRSTPSVRPSVTKFCVIRNSKSIKATSFKLYIVIIHVYILMMCTSYLGEI